MPYESGSLYSRKTVSEAALLLAIGVALFLCWRLAEPFLTALTWALALAVVGHPLNRLLERHLNPAFAALLSLIIITAILLAPGFLLIQNLRDEATNGLALLRSNLNSESLHHFASRYAFTARLMQWLEAHTDLDQELSRLAGVIAAKTPAALRGSVQVIAQFAIMLVVLFYFFRDRAQLLRILGQLIPLSPTEISELYRRVSETIRATLYGNLAVKLIQGLLGGLMFWILGLPAPLLFGLAMGFTALVPLVGTSVIWGPAAIYLLLHGSWIKALILAAWGGLVVSLVDNILYPILVAGELRIHTLGVFLSVLGGLITFGLTGLVLGPVILATTVALVNIWRLRIASAIAPGTS